ASANRRCSRSRSRVSSRVREAAARADSAAASRQWAIVSCSRAVLRATAAALSAASARPGSPGVRSGSSLAPPPARRVRCAPDAGLGAAPACGEALLHLGETAGVEQPPEEPAAGFGVGAQEAREVALGQQHDLAELLAAHAEELGDLLADLLVRAAEVLPGAAHRVVFGQPGLGLVDGGAGAAFLRALPGRLPGDAQAPSGDGEFEGDLGAGAGGRVVAAQGDALAAAGL